MVNCLDDTESVSVHAEKIMKLQLKYSLHFFNELGNYQLFK